MRERDVFRAVGEKYEILGSGRSHLSGNFCLVFFKRQCLLNVNPTQLNFSSV